MMKKKTLSGWNKSNLDLEDYLPSPCEIDENLFNYIGECVPPQYLGGCLVQGGDAIKSEQAEDVDDRDVYYYMTAMHANGKYFYLGVLPEFRQ